MFMSTCSIFVDLNSAGPDRLTVYRTNIQTNKSGRVLTNCVFFVLVNPFFLCRSCARRCIHQCFFLSLLRCPANCRIMMLTAADFIKLLN